MYKNFGDGIIITINRTEENQYLRYIGDRYDVDNISKKGKDTYILTIFNGEISGYPKLLYDKFLKLEKIINESKKWNEVIDNIYIRNNEIWFHIIFEDGTFKDTNLRGYTKILKAREELNDLAQKRGHKILSTYKDSHSEILIDYQCGHEPRWVNANSYKSQNIGCNICSKKIVIPFVNDCYTMRKDLLKYFINEEDAIGMSISDHQRKFFKCPDCGTPRINALSNISYFGFSCPNCKDCLSYAEKIMYLVLKQLNIDFLIHENPEWCTYIINDLERKGFYDFIIENQKIIIEMDGGYHYEPHRKDIKTLDEINEIDRCKDECALNNGYKIYRLDCRYNNTSKRFKIIKEEIINKLSILFDLQYVDWDLIQKSAITSTSRWICDLWNSGLSVSEIIEETKMCKDTVIHSLREGNETGCCVYNPPKHMSYKKNYLYNKNVS